MKKISLICAAMLVGLSLSGCNNLASQQMHKNSSSSSSAKVVKHHKAHKKHNKANKNRQSSKPNSASAKTASKRQLESQTQTSNTSSTQQDGYQASTQQPNNQPSKHSSDSLYIGLYDNYNKGGGAGENTVEYGPGQESQASSAAQSMADNNENGQHLVIN